VGPPNQLVDVAQFGDPKIGSTTYHLCIYDTNAGTPSLALGSEIPFGANWTRTGSGFRYLNKAHTPDGVGRVVLKRNYPTSSGSITVSGVGINLPVPTPVGSQVLQQDTQVIVQLQPNGGADCFGAVFPAPALNSSGQLFLDTLP